MRALTCRSTSGLPDHLKQVLFDTLEINPQRRLVVAYSGGVDSQVLLHALVNLRKTMALDLLDSPKFAQADTTSLSSMGIGGSATPPKVSKMMEEKVPNNFAGTGYGLTETNAQGASLTGKAFEFKPGSAGFPHPIVELKICGENGEELPVGETGEIWVRSVCNIPSFLESRSSSAAASLLISAVISARFSLTMAWAFARASASAAS